METNTIVAPNQCKMKSMFGFGQWLLHGRLG
jgi:hypothetical protein